MAVLQAGLPGPEQAEWLASLRLDPPEEDRADIRHAQMMVALTGAKPDDIMAALPWRVVPTSPTVAPSPATKQASLRKRIDLAMRAFQSKYATKGSG